METATSNRLLSSQVLLSDPFLAAPDRLPLPLQQLTRSPTLLASFFCASLRLLRCHRSHSRFSLYLIETFLDSLFFYVLFSPGNARWAVQGTSLVDLCCVLAIGDPTRHPHPQLRSAVPRMRSIRLASVLASVAGLATASPTPTEPEPPTKRSTLPTVAVSGNGASPRRIMLADGTFF